MMKAPVLASFALALLLQDQCPDYTKDDHEGEVPEGAEPSPHQKSLHVNNPHSIPLRCNQIHRISATHLDAPAECANYDFTAIWTAADREARARVEALSCPKQDCRDLKTWREWQSWNCTPSATPGAAAAATATVSFAAACPREGADGIPIPNSIRRPTADQLKVPSTNPTAAPPADESLETTTPVPQSMGCTPKEIVAFHLRERAATRPKSLEPWVIEARAEAQAHHRAIRCAAGCKKTQFNPAVTWSWANGTISVDVLFVACE